ncbi:outer membrane beta-barrel protein [Alteromonas facilis]|uniref:outer membrane beta-barrel protein n=1 Tax=Alteromonas facilis TaxID=2048004 RepID=UPI000C281FA2|nr:outer membrane beta-barrel protein [Alteromonas facilis]
MLRKLACCKIAALALLTSFNSVATERMYGVISAGYADSEFAQYSDGGVAYKLALGHQFHPQWYVEGGFQRIADDAANATDPMNGLEGDALFVSVLGKAGSKDGELFYRVGVMRADLTGNRVLDDIIEPYDDGVMAGIVGVGFDWFVGLNTMVRFEVEYIGGEDDFQSSAAYVGLRYNFN